MSAYMFVVLLCFHVTYGQKYCCYPDKWEGIEGLISGSADDEGHGAITQGEIMVSMDATQEAIYTRESLTVNGQPRQLDVLELYAQNSRYIISDGKCTRTVVGKWTSDQHCIPDSAILLRKYYIGNSQKLQLSEYQIGLDTLTLNVAVTDDCVPFSEFAIGNLQGTNLLTSTGFFNITAGIKDPGVFDIPAICKSAPLTPEPMYRRRRSLFSHDI